MGVVLPEMVSRFYQGAQIGLLLRVGGGRIEGSTYPKNLVKGVQVRVGGDVFAPVRICP